MFISLSKMGSLSLKIAAKLGYPHLARIQDLKNQKLCQCYDLLLIHQFITDLEPGLVLSKEYLSLYHIYCLIYFVNQFACFLTETHWVAMHFFPQLYFEQVD